MDRRVALLLKLWHSASAMQGFSQIARAAAFAVPLPLIFVVFPAEVAALWLLFVTIQSFQLLADLGFTLTYSRILAYAAAGATTVGDLRETRSYVSRSGPNWPLLWRIFSVMHQTFKWVAICWLLLLAVVGSVVVARPIQMLESPWAGWTAWAILVVLSTVRVLSNMYVSYLLGMNRVAILRRVEGTTWCAVAVGALVMLWLFPSLITLVAVIQSGWLINFLRLRRISERTELERSRRQNSALQGGADEHRQIFQQVWSRVWRTGSGMAVFYGAMQATGIFFAQVGAPEQITAYLLALNIANFVQQLGSSPFQSKLPKLAQLRAEGASDKQNSLAERGMRSSLWLVTIGFVAAGTAVPGYFQLPDVEGAFVPLKFWALMGVGMLLLRFGSYHLQYYSVTNDIIWHRVNLWAGAILMVSTVGFYPILRWYAFPAGIILSCVLYYSWVPAIRSYRAFAWDFPGFVLRPTLGPAVTTAAYGLLVILGPALVPWLSGLLR